MGLDGNNRKVSGKVTLELDSANKENVDLSNSYKANEYELKETEQVIFKCSELIVKIFDALDGGIKIDKVEPPYSLHDLRNMMAFIEERLNKIGLSTFYSDEWNRIGRTSEILVPKMVDFDCKIAANALAIKPGSATALLKHKRTFHQVKHNIPIKNESEDEYDDFLQDQPILDTPALKELAKQHNKVQVQRLMSARNRRRSTLTSIAVRNSEQQQRLSVVSNELRKTMTPPSSPTKVTF